MVVTSVRVTPVEKDRLLAVASVTLCDCFVLRAMRLVDGHKRKYVAMPIRQSKTGEVFEVFHPINSETRASLEEIIVEEYEKRSAGSPVVEPEVRYLGSECADFIITSVRVRCYEGIKLRGFASMVIDDCLAITGIKIIAGKHKSFVQMPNVKRKNGKLRDLAFPTRPETRNQIEEVVFREFKLVSEQAPMQESEPLPDGLEEGN
jgi:stage V sporulation protein G